MHDDHAQGNHGGVRNVNTSACQKRGDRDYDFGSESDEDTTNHSRCKQR
ncbi:hypothetical protein HMPREF9594_00490 [Cutibacterium acnes HL005PA1]|nr:hypothetical protein HMPREF9575_01320 [Cutibacterium acnes HL110PA1]EFT29455.1 hypothetical protein HMPREF9594_00490 [Cutibacterium acnes HL005PA1]